jgi:hypothetical protein
MSSETVARWISEAKALGVDHAHSAADWTFDGNSDQAERARVLDMMQDGDPAAFDYLPQEPNLSGQWADDLTPDRLYEQITGKCAGLAIGAVLIDALADAYEDGVSETFAPACEAALVEFVR